jgi:DNA-binding transcriptional ArsR family regulator
MQVSIPVAVHLQFAYDQSVDVELDLVVSRIAAAIGEPARARMLYCLMDGHARTSTELAMVGEVSPSTASVHLSRLSSEQLVKMRAQGKHRYYMLHGPNVACALESLSVLAGRTWDKFVPSTPARLRTARTCYDHLAGTLGVSLFDCIKARSWLFAGSGDAEGYEVTPAGSKAFASLGIDLEATRAQRRRFAYGCVDWSERRPHIGGALGAALLKIVQQKRWVIQEVDSRALRVTLAGRQEMLRRFGIHISASGEILGLQSTATAKRDRSSL